MRMDRSRGETLAERLATVDERALADVIWRYGEERRSRRVARVIVEARDRGGLTDTVALASVVRRGVGGAQLAAGGSGDSHVPGTADLGERRNRRPRAFRQAAWDAVAVGGRLADHLVSFARGPRGQADLSPARRGRRRGTAVDRRPIVAGDEERERNPRARSARLRGLERVA